MEITFIFMNIIVVNVLFFFPNSVLLKCGFECTVVSSIYI